MSGVFGPVPQHVMCCNIDLSQSELPGPRASCSSCMIQKLTNLMIQKITNYMIQKTSTSSAMLGTSASDTDYINLITVWVTRTRRQYTNKYMGTIINNSILSHFYHFFIVNKSFWNNFIECFWFRKNVCFENDSFNNNSISHLENQMLFTYAGLKQKHSFFRNLDSDLKYLSWLHNL